MIEFSRPLSSDFDFTFFGRLFPLGIVVDTNDSDKSALASVGFPPNRLIIRSLA